jgi:succinate-semialdehyde dehydrogenase / glutarate-semialdehyde dehydrogenase
MSTAPATAVSSVNPATGETLRSYPVDGPGAINATLERAAAAQRAWRAESLGARAGVVRALAMELRARGDEIAELVTAEMGKTLGEARAEAEKCAWLCEHYADASEEYLRAVPIDTEWRDSYVQFPPLGVVLAIMPWNYPFWQVLRAAVPALMAGNAVVLKHASNVTGSGLLLRDIVAGLDGGEDVLAAVVVPGASVAPLIGDRRVAAVTLTGSEAVGARVAEACAAHLKKSVLELGGSDAFIVLEDADLEAAATVGSAARFQNAGQSCIAAKRFIVVDAVAGEFAERLAAAAGALVNGDPADPATTMGPMARADLRDELADQVRRGVEVGGQVLTGGEVTAGPGAYYPPTVVAGVQPGTPLFDEETFGPVAAVVRARDEDDALELANATPYGLSSSLWTADVERARRLAGRIEAGGVFVNTMTASDPRVPFGGIKRSGWGRELGRWGIHEFVNAQSVTIAPKSA